VESGFLILAFVENNNSQSLAGIPQFQVPYLRGYDNRKNSGNAGTGDRSKEVSLTSGTGNIKSQKKNNFH